MSDPQPPVPTVDARRWLKNTLKDIYSERHVDPTVTPTINEVLDHYFQYLSTQEAKSLRQARSHAKHVRVAIGDLLAPSLTTALVRDYQDAQLANGMSRAAVNRQTEVLRAAIRLALRDGNCGVRTVPHIPRLKRENSEKSGYIHEALYEAIVADLPEYLRWFMRFLYWTGWRPGMARALTWRMVDRRARTILLPDSKNDDPQRIPLIGQVGAIINHQWQLRPYADGEGERLSEYVFHRAGKPIGDYRKAWRRACQQHGLSRRRDCGVTPKAFRNTFATNASEARIPREVIKDIAGWTTDSMFYRYAIDIGTQDRKRRALETLEQHLAEERQQRSSLAPFRRNVDERS